MGATGSVVANAASSAEQTESGDGAKNAPKVVELKKLPDAIEEAVYVHEKFPLIIDTTEQAGRFLKYQTGTFISFDDPVQSMKGNLNKSLAGSFQYGRTLTLKFKSLEGMNESIFEPNVFPKEILCRSKFFTDEVWKSVLPPKKSDDEDDITISSEFVFILCTNTDFVPPALYEWMHVIKVVDKLAAPGANNGASVTEEDPMEQIAMMFGAKEVIRLTIPPCNLCNICNTVAIACSAATLLLKLLSSVLFMHGK